MSLMLRPLARYADFKGRARRSEYWLFILFQFVVYAVGLGLSIGLMASGDMGQLVLGGLLLLALPVLIGLGLFIPNLAVLVRRLHDIGLPGWFLLLQLPGLVHGFTSSASYITMAQQMANGGQTDALENSLLPIVTTLSPLGILGMVCSLILTVMMLWPGTTGANRFGPDPKGGHIDVSVFDDTRIEEAIARAKAEANLDQPPHKPIFDFGPSSTGPMIAANAHQSGQAPAPSAPTASPSSAGWAPAYDPGIRPSKPFGRRA